MLFSIFAFFNGSKFYLLQLLATKFVFWSQRIIDYCTNTKSIAYQTSFASITKIKFHSNHLTTTTTVTLCSSTKSWLFTINRHRQPANWLTTIIENAVSSMLRHVRDTLFDCKHVSFIMRFIMASEIWFNWISFFPIFQRSALVTIRPTALKPLTCWIWKRPRRGLGGTSSKFSVLLRKGRNCFCLFCARAETSVTNKYEMLENRYLLCFVFNQNKAN